MTVRKTSEEIAEILQSLQKKCWAKDRILAEEIGISVPEFNLLTFFYNESSLPVKKLTLSMNVTPGRITHLVTSLEKRGLMKRSLNKDDRRVVLVTLTKKGRQLVDKIYGLVNDFFNEMLSTLNSKDQEILLSKLRQLGTIMDGKIISND